MERIITAGLMVLAVLVVSAIVSTALGLWMKWRDWR